MVANYIYTISSIPGGFDSDAVDRLSSLIRRNIPVSLSKLEVRNNTLLVGFDGNLTVDQRTCLDNNQVSPVGGLVSAATHKIRVSVDGVVKVGSDKIIVPANGTTYKTITLQKANNSGPIPANGESVILDPDLMTINKLSGVLDATGKFEFIVGPDFKKGNASVSVKVDTFKSFNLVFLFS